MRIPTLVSLILLSSSVFSQNNQVVDSETDKAVAFARITSFLNDTTFYTDVNGRFTWNDKTDTLLVFCPGYERQTILTDTINNVTIRLSKKAYVLNEVAVVGEKPKYKYTNIGVDSKPKTTFISYTYVGSTGETKAVWIPNEKNLKGYVEEINIYITNDGYPSSYFRVHIYDCSPLSIKPGKELIEENLIVKGTIGNEWITISFKDKPIQLPENGIFVGIEWLPETKELTHTDTVRIMRDDEVLFQFNKDGNGVVLGSVDELYATGKYKIWKKVEEDWDLISDKDESDFNKIKTFESGKEYIINENNSYLHLPCIYARVKYVKKSKERTDVSSWKKRKLNKIKKTKQDLFKYPQSSIDDLFGSLIKAFENDEVIYVLNHLCAYSKDDYQRLLTITEGQTEGNILNPGEKEEILLELRALRAAFTGEVLHQLTINTYELRIDEYTYGLVNDNGLWKINPYHYKILKV